MYYFQGSRIAEAEQWFRRAQRLAPSDPSVYHYYGEFLPAIVTLVSCQNITAIVKSFRNFMW